MAKRGAEEGLVRQSAIVSGINRVLREVLTCETEEELAKICLAVALELTGSEFGFIGELNEKGRLDTIAISDTGWAACGMADENTPKLVRDMEVRGIWSRVFKDERPVVTNEPASHPDRVGTPEGHPRLTFYLGVPLKEVGKTFGIISLANKKSGHTQADVEAIESLSVVIVEMLKCKRVEKALRENEKKYRILVEKANDAVVVIQDERFKFANPKFLGLTGCSFEEITRGHFTDFIYPDDRELVYGRYLKRIKGEEVPNVYVHRLVSKNGDVHWVEVNANQILWEGKPAVLSIVTDITERKRAEEEKRRWEQRAQVTSRLAAVGEMAAGIAHEINNPLTSVIGFSQLLMQKDLSNDIKKDLMIINEGAQRVASIVRKLLTFARQQKPERKLVDINELITNTLAFCSYTLRANNIKVVTKLEPELPLTVADAGQLQQVFLNIIMNAEKEMRLACGKGKLSIKTEQVDSTILISFKDNGPGIAEENLGRIFDPFFTTHEVGEGTGLGLSLCHGIVIAHRGRIWAESESGKGATFFVELPIVTKEEQLELPEPPEEKPPKVTKARILVVDDEPTTLQFLSRLLAGEGHEVDTAGSATEALEKVRERRYKLILLDIKMPGMSGIELYEKLCKIAKSLARRVLFVTGDVMGARTAAFFSRTKAPYITKPFNIEQLKKGINRVLSE